MKKNNQKRDDFVNIRNASKIIICLILSVFYLFSGCAEKKNSDQQNNIVLTVYRLIDEQRSGEAIELLENALLDEPSNYEYKVVLASAYAHKGGIKIQKLVPVVSQAEKMSEMNEKLLKTDKNKKTSAQVNDGSLNIATLLTQFAMFFQVYAAIPTVDKTQALYLNHAVYLLNELGNQIKPEDVLYKAVLEIVLFKFTLSEGLMGELIEPNVKTEQTCRINLAHVNDSIIKSGKLLINIYNDISFANPKQAKEMKKLAIETSDLISDLTIMITAGPILDDANNAFLKEAAIKNGFGKMVRCDVD